MRIVERMEKLGDKIFFFGRVSRKNGSWMLGGGESEAHPRGDCCAWSGRLETLVDSKREEDDNDRVTDRAGDREASRVPNTAVGKLL